MGLNYCAAARNLNSFQLWCLTEPWSLWRSAATTITRAWHGSSMDNRACCQLALTGHVNELYVCSWFDQSLYSLCRRSNLPVLTSWLYMRLLFLGDRAPTNSIATPTYLSLTWIIYAPALDSCGSYYINPLSDLENHKICKVAGLEIVHNIHPA